MAPCRYFVMTNRCDWGVGHLFQSRFKRMVQDSQEWELELSRKNGGLRLRQLVELLEIGNGSVRMALYRFERLY